MTFSRHRLPWCFAGLLVITMGTLSVVACSSDDEDQAAASKAAADKAKADRSASTDFVPADAADQPPKPPGAGPYNGPAPTEAPPPPPPPSDAGVKDSAPETGSE